MAGANARTLTHDGKLSRFANDRLANGPPRLLFTNAEWQRLSDAFELTPRQCRIAQLMCEGLTYKSIAARACISINTVRMHMRTLFTKLGVHDRVAFILQLVLAERVLASRAREGHGGS